MPPGRATSRPTSSTRPSTKPARSAGQAARCDCIDRPPRVAVEPRGPAVQSEVLARPRPRGGGAHRHAHRSHAHRRVAAPSPTALPVPTPARRPHAGGSVPSWFTLSTHATLLADGRVLVQATDGTMYAWAPSTRSFESLGTTGVWRAQSTLLSMPDGRVAVVGGDLRRIDATSGVAVASTIEFFDPETGGSSPAVPMNVPRYVYGAILLRDGRVPRGWRHNTR